MTNMLQKPACAQWRIKRFFLKNCSTFRFSDGLRESKPFVFHCVAAVRNSLMFFPLCPQFVPFRDYMDRTGNHVLSMARLAKDVLAEIPDQFISYMKSRGIKPNPAPPPYTPPGHTHHHTQIWGRPLCVWLRTNSVQLLRSPAGTLCLLFLRYNQEPTHQEDIVEFPASAKQHSEQHLIVFLFSCVDLSVFSQREDANCPGLVGKSLLLDATRQWLFDVWLEVMLWFKLVPVCDCFSKYIRTREDRPELTRSSLWPIPSGFFWRSSPFRISFYIWEYCQDVIEDHRLICSTWIWLFILGGVAFIYFFVTKCVKEHVF